MKQVKDNITKDYGVVIDVVDIVPGSTADTSGDNTGFTNRDMYEDEYDDTYDTTNVGADDADSADELTNVR